MSEDAELLRQYAQRHLRNWLAAICPWSNLPLSAEPSIRRIGMRNAAASANYLFLLFPVDMHCNIR